MNQDHRIPVSKKLQLGGFRHEQPTWLASTCHGLFVTRIGPAVFAQTNHLPALRDWQYHQEQAAKYFEQGNYVKAEQRLNLAIKNIRPYLPDTRRIMAKSYSDLARCSIIKDDTPRASLWPDGPSRCAIPTNRAIPMPFFSVSMYSG